MDLDLLNCTILGSGILDLIFRTRYLVFHYFISLFNVQLLDENRWYNFDDSHISLINEEDVKSAAAYVLFYRRVKGDDSSATNGAPSSANHDNMSCRK